MNRRINQAVRRGDLISYADLFSGYPKKRQQEILKKASIELKYRLYKLREEGVIFDSGLNQI